MIAQNKEEFEISNIDIWQKDNSGEGTHILVLDQGVELFKYYDNVEMLTFESEINYKQSNHGNAILATGYQIAPKTKVTYIPLNSLKGYGGDRALDWVEENIEQFDVITLSLNFSHRWAKKMFDRFAKYKVPFFVAVGNESEASIHSPANYPYTIAVGSAYYMNNKPNVGRESNWGKEIDILGFSNIYYPNNEGKEVGQIGTSIATPFVAYSTLLYISWRKKNGLPKFTIDEWREWQKPLALDIKGEGFDVYSGWGVFRLPNKILKLDAPEKPKEPEKGDDDLAKFKDTKGHWAEQEIDFVANKGWITGYPDGNFQPDKPMTRAEVASVLAKQAGFIKKK